MKRVMASLLLAAFAGCGGMPIDGTNPTNSANVVGACNTTYYNSQYLFGFDLPANAELQGITKNEGSIIFSPGWLFMFDGDYLAFTVIVGENPGVTLADWVAHVVERKENVAGEQLLEVFPFTLADGTDAYFYLTFDSFGWTSYIIDAFANGYNYRFVGLSEGVPTDAENAYMIAILDSFCVD